MAILAAAISSFILFSGARRTVGWAKARTTNLDGGQRRISAFAHRTARSAPLPTLRRCEQAAMAGDRPPRAEELQRVADDGGLIAQHRLVEFGLEPRCDRLREPRAAADIDRVAVGVG